jgi:hypothetical protein
VKPFFRARRTISRASGNVIKEQHSTEKLLADTSRASVRKSQPMKL